MGPDTDIPMGIHIKGHLLGSIQRHSLFGVKGNVAIYTAGALRKIHSKLLLVLGGSKVLRMEDHLRRLTCVYLSGSGWK